MKLLLCAGLLTLFSLATIGYVKPQISCDNNHYKCWVGDHYECCPIFDR